MGPSKTPDAKAIEHNTHIANEVIKRWSIEKGGDVEPFFELFHDDATFTTMAQKGMLPILAGTLTKDEFRAWVFKETRVGSTVLNLEGITASEDRVAVEASSDMNINGNEYKNVYHSLFEVRDRKISAARFYLDTLLAYETIKWVEDAEKAQKEAGTQ